MLRNVLSLTLLLFLFSPLSAQNEPLDITGKWSSSTGAVVEIPAWSKSRDQFSLIVYKGLDGPELFRTRARWLSEDRYTFTYGMPNGEIITGVVQVDLKEVNLKNESGTWSSRWIRALPAAGKT